VDTDHDRKAAWQILPVAFLRYLNAKPPQNLIYQTQIFQHERPFQMLSTHLPNDLIAWAKEQSLEIKQPLASGKVMLSGQEDNRLIKVGFTKLGIHLVEQEIAGWALVSPLLKHRFRIGEIAGFAEAPTWIAARLEYLSGQTTRSFFPTHREISSSLAPSATTLDFKDVLELERTPPEISKRLFQRYGDPPIPVTISHGDYIYWNLIDQPGHAPGIIDFEYAQATRLTGFDDLHFRFAPWWARLGNSRWAHSSLQRLLRYLIRSSTHSNLETDLIADLYFVHWTGIRRRIEMRCSKTDPMLPIYQAARQRGEAMLTGN
jgi:hypothetical protein